MRTEGKGIVIIIIQGRSTCQAQAGSQTPGSCSSSREVPPSALRGALLGRHRSVRPVRPGDPQERDHSGRSPPHPRKLLRGRTLAGVRRAPGASLHLQVPRRHPVSRAGRRGGLRRGGEGLLHPRPGQHARDRCEQEQDPPEDLHQTPRWARVEVRREHQALHPAGKITAVDPLNNTLITLEGNRPACENSCREGDVCEGKLTFARTSALFIQYVV